jgi:serine/threonine protein kinase
MSNEDAKGAGPDEQATLYAAPGDLPTLKPQAAKPASTSRAGSGGKRWVPPSVAELQRMLPQYEFIAMLGAGGMGAVYKARQVSLDRVVAIKILPPDIVDDSGANFVERFKQEAKTMARMNHPCIVNVYDFGETPEGQLYFAMEFVEGTDVQKMIREKKRLPADDALAIAAHVCDALEYAHECGVIHRDIKPANVLISQEGRVKIADFGLAKAVDSKSHELTRSNMAMGTPHYMAPEALFADAKVDSRADLYAVGVMLYTMLTGELPTGMFKPASVKTGCDARIDALVKRAMEPDREERYQKAAEFREGINEILTTPVTKLEGDATRPLPQTQSPKKGQAGKAAGGGTGKIIGFVVATAVVLIGIFAWSPWNKREPGTTTTKQFPPSAAQTQAVTQAAAPPAFVVPKPVPDAVRQPATNQAAAAEQFPQPTVQTQVVTQSAAAPAVVAPKPERVLVQQPATNQAAGVQSQTQTAQQNQKLKPVALPPGAIDLLANVDVKRDSFFSPWVIESGTLKSPAAQRGGENYETIQMPAMNVPPEYDLRMSLRRDEPGLQVRILFVKEGKGGSVRIDSDWREPVVIDDATREKRDASGPNVSRPKLFKPGETHDVVVQVRNEYVAVLFDGTEMARSPDGRWKTNQYGPGNPTSMQKPPFIGVSFCRGSLSVLSAAICRVGSSWISLLNKVDPKADAVQGVWTKTPDGLMGEFKGIGVLQLPYAPPEEYDFRIAYNTVRGGGAGVIAQILTAFGHDFRWQAQSGGAEKHLVTGFALVDGKFIAHSPASVPTPERGVPNRRYVSLVEVRRDRVTGYIDGKKMVEWKTDYHDMVNESTYALHEPHRLGISMWSSSTLFDDISVRAVTGQGKLLR